MAAADDVLVLDALGKDFGATGLVTGLLYARTRSVAAGVAAHVVYVAVSLAARHALGW